MRVLTQVTPTAEQLPVLADDGIGFRLIRGAAGSGKTTVALLRLRQLCASRISRNARLGLVGHVRVLVLTFNRTLRSYIAQLVNEGALSDPQRVHLAIDTFGRWAQTLVGPRDVVDDRRRRSVLERLLRETRVPIVAANLPYFVNEVEYIVSRFERENRQDYVRMDRTGRGRSPPVPRAMRATLLSDVVAPYEEWKTQHGQLDWNDIALAAISASDERYDVVIVDEAQDLSANQVRAILSHLADDHVTTFIIDAVQRIYPQGFTWREVGIEMRPNLVFQLRANHRNTAQIARLAQSLVHGLPHEEDGVIPDAAACNRQGPMPAMLAGTYSHQLHHMLAHIAPALASGETVAILQPKGGGWFDYARQELGRRGIAYCELTRQSDWPSGPEQLALSTIHSAKGLEFDHVLMPGLNSEVTSGGGDADDGDLDSLRRLVAMGIGRAPKRRFGVQARRSIRSRRCDPPRDLRAFRGLRRDGHASGGGASENGI